MSLLAAKFIFTTVDSKGKTSKTEIKVPITTDFNDLAPAALQFAIRIAPLIGNRITAIRACIGLNVTTFAATSPTSDIQEKALFVFRDTQGLFTKMLIPTLDETVVAPSSDAIDQADANVAGFLNLMINGDGTIAPVSQRDFSIAQATVARELFRRIR